MSREEKIGEGWFKAYQNAKKDVDNLQARIKELEDILDGYNEPKPNTKKPNYLLDKL